MAEKGTTRRRLAKSGDLKRIHTHMHPDWAKEIDKASKLKGVSRSHFIATAAFQAAAALLKRGRRRAVA